MKNLKWIGFLAAALLLVIPAAGLSHHSHAMFDYNNEVSVTGVVATVQSVASASSTVSQKLESPIPGQSGEIDQVQRSTFLPGIDHQLAHDL